MVDREKYSVGIVFNRSCIEIVEQIDFFFLFFLEGNTMDGANDSFEDEDIGKAV